MEIATNFKRSSKTHFDISVCERNAKHFDEQNRTCWVNKKNIVAKLLDTEVFFFFLMVQSFERIKISWILVSVLIAKGVVSTAG